MAKTFTYDEVTQHNTTDSCWVILYGNVWDVTKFLPEHPGGSKIILQLAGTDATEEYDPIHPPGTLEGSLPAEAKLGKIDESTLPREEKAPVQEAGSVSPQSSNRLFSGNGIPTPWTSASTLTIWNILR